MIEQRKLRRLTGFARIMLAAVLLAAASPGVMAGDDRWKDNGNNTLTDTFAGLTWTKRDNLKDVDWEGAKHYCDTLSLAGGGWHLPEIDDLAALYDGGGRYGTTKCRTNTCKVYSHFYLTGSWFWSSTRGERNKDSSERAWGILLDDGYRGEGLVYVSEIARALCVRRP